MNEINVKLRLRLIWLSLFCIFIFTIIVGYFVAKELRDWFLIFQTGIITIALIYTSLNLQLNIDLNKQKQENDLKNQSFNFINKWTDPNFSKKMGFAMAFFYQNRDKSGSELYAILENDYETREAVSNLFNQLEIIAFSVKYKVADELIIKDFFKEIFISTYSLTKKYIDERRDSKTSQNILIDFETYSKKWTKS